MVACAGLSVSMTLMLGMIVEIIQAYSQRILSTWKKTYPTAIVVRNFTLNLFKVFSSEKFVYHDHLLYCGNSILQSDRDGIFFVSDFLWIKHFQLLDSRRQAESDK